MKVVQINATCQRGSTGKICVAISQLLTERKIENYILYSGVESDYDLGIQCGDAKAIRFQALCSHLNGFYGFNSKGITQKLLKELDLIQPDIVHLHNLHGHNCHIGMLLNYLKTHRIKVYWTFHDCWAFTAYCPHFTMAQCEKWKTGCHDCPQYRSFSFFFDRSKDLFAMKKSAVDGLDLTIITPSQWLADLVKQSFFKGYPVKVINNGIDLDVFKPTQSDFRERHGIKPDQKLLLGVAFGWGRRKGLDVFVELARRLDPTVYRIVLVGTDDETDRQLPEGVISIHRTQNQTELAGIYTVADLFVNPTREEVFGLVNVEALACGTPGVTFASGGSPECYDETCGSVVPKDDVDAMEREIRRICEQKPFETENCYRRAQAYKQNVKFMEYIRLYQSFIED